MSERLGPYLLGPNETAENGIYTGDARILSEAIPDESVDLVFTDPPWGINYNYGNMFIDSENGYVDFIKAVAKESGRILKPGCFSFIYQATKRLRQTWQAFPENSRLFASCKNFIQLKNLPVEYAVDFIVFWQKQGKFPLNGMCRDWNVAKTSNTKKGSRGQGFIKLPAPPRPLDAVMDIISQMCIPDGIVVDFFCGTGTMAVACRLLDHRYLAFEIDSATAKLARERVRQTQPPLPGLVLESQTNLGLPDEKPPHV